MPAAGKKPSLRSGAGAQGQGATGGGSLRLASPPPESRQHPRNYGPANMRTGSPRSSSPSRCAVVMDHHLDRQHAEYDNDRVSLHRH